MSYYVLPYKYALTHHALRRAKERLKLKDLSDFEIQTILEEYLELAIFNGYKEGNCVVMKNMQHNITFVLDNTRKIIKTLY